MKLESKNLFIFNLVLIGIIFGFALAFFSFSCQVPQNKDTVKAGETTDEAGALIVPAALNAPIVQAQESKSSVPQSAFIVAETLQNVFRAVSEKVLPSVVEITTISVRRQQAPNFNGIPFEFFFGPQDDTGEQEREYRSQGLGSGIIVRHDKDTYYVLTNNHVVSDANEISIVSNDGKEYPAELVGKDERKDLAMVKFTTEDSLPVAVLGDSNAVKVGDWAIAVGTPMGFMSSVTMGIVSAVGRTGGPANNINDFIQTDASINQGNSGGALVNIRGEVIGINTWIVSNNAGGSVGLGFAIPINNAKRSIDEFISNGEISYGWLGVSLTDPSKDILQALNLTATHGAFASQVFLGSPADKGGIQPGDFITHVNGKEMRGMNQLTLAVGELSAGERAQFTLIRDGVSRTVTVLIEARNEQVTTDNKKLWPGVYLIPITDSIRSSLKLSADTSGLYAAQVYPGTPAAVIGLQQGDRITAINGKSVADLASFYKVLRENAGTELQFTVIRGESTLKTLTIKKYD
ncbi:MAG: Do family serine endopeptidase [Spirochaetaceae bacterium]|jgi:Do/DeqQ family serine protease|nr:Do family serine endopeptidase [Spirochaetaceae bacterium]